MCVLHPFNDPIGSLFFLFRFITFTSFYNTLFNLKIKTMKKILLKAFMLLCLILWGGVSSAWAETTNYTTSTWPTTGWSATKGGSITVNDISWTYSTATYLGVSNNKVQIGSKNNPQTSDWTLSTSISNFGDGAKVTAVKINAYTTATTATYDISVGGSSKQSGSLAESAADYTASGLNATSGDIVITLTGSSTSKAMYLASVTVTYETTATGPVDASWSVSPAEIAVKTGKSASATVTTNYDGELIAETNDANVATCSFEDGVLTVTGVSAGTTIITFLGEETSKYNEIEEEVTVTVTDPAVFDPSNFVIGDFVDDIPAAVDGNITFNLGNYSFEVKKNNGGTAPTVHSTALDMRIYAKGTITISSATKQFNGVVFNISEQGLKRLAPITADCGTVATQASGDETVTWSSTIPVSSVTFTVGDNANYGSDGSTKAGQLDFVSLSINEVAAPTSTDVTISPAGYATFFDAIHAVTLPEGVTGYVFTADGGLQSAYGTSESDKVVPAGEPLVLGGAANTYTLSYTTSTEDTWKSIGMNDLDGTDEETALTPNDNYYFYGLSLNASSELSSVGFYWMNETGAAFTNGAHKAYLKLPKSMFEEARSGYAFNEDTEALESIEMSAATTIYTLNGVKVNELQKGLNIVNGKKVMVK